MSDLVKRLRDLCCYGMADEVAGLERERDDARHRLAAVQKAARNFVYFPNPIDKCEACGEPVPDDDRLVWDDGVVTHASDCCAAIDAGEQRQEPLTKEVE